MAIKEYYNEFIKAEQKEELNLKRRVSKVSDKNHQWYEAKFKQ